MCASGLSGLWDKGTRRSESSCRVCFTFFLFSRYHTCARVWRCSGRRVRRSLCCRLSRMFWFLPKPKTIPAGRPVRTYSCSLRFVCRAPWGGKKKLKRVKPSKTRCHYNVQLKRVIDLSVLIIIRHEVGDFCRRSTNVARISRVDTFCSSFFFLLEKISRGRGGGLQKKSIDPYFDATLKCKACAFGIHHENRPPTRVELYLVRVNIVDNSLWFSTLIHTTDILLSSIQLLKRDNNIYSCSLHLNPTYTTNCVFLLN